METIIITLVGIIAITSLFNVYLIAKNNESTNENGTYIVSTNRTIHDVIKELIYVETSIKSINQRLSEIVQLNSDNIDNIKRIEENNLKFNEEILNKLDELEELSLVWSEFASNYFDAKRRKKALPAPPEFYHHEISESENSENRRDNDDELVL